MGKPPTNYPGHPLSDVYSVERLSQPAGTSQWETVLTLEPEGFCDCADIAASYPTAWALTGLASGWRVLIRTGKITHLVAQGTFPFTGVYQAGANYSTILHRIRGQNFDQVIVEILCVGPGNVATFRIAGWARSVFSWDSYLSENGTIPTTAYPPDGYHWLWDADDSGHITWQNYHLQGVQIYNPNAVDTWFLMWDLAAVPAPATPPEFAPLLIPAGASDVSRDFPSLLLANGLSWVSSSTPAIYTVPAPLAPLWVDAFRTPDTP